MQDQAFRANKWAWRSRGNEVYGGHRAEVRFCLGVLKCASCGHLARPNTNDLRRTEQLTVSECPNRRCREKGSLEQYGTKCEAEVHLWSEEQDGETTLFWEHTGFHYHPHPPGGRLSLPEQETIDSQVIRRPDASVHQLRTGDAAPGSVPLGEINPILANPRSARYAVSKSQTRLGIQPATAAKGGLSILNDLATLRDKLGLDFIVESSFSGPTYFTLQTPFMVQVIEESVEDWVLQDRQSPDSGRHGFVTDGDHTFFTLGTLLATCAFSTTMGQWIPVLYTWVHGLDVLHHSPHFRRLNTEILRASGHDFQAKYLTAVSIDYLFYLYTVINTLHIDS